MGQKFSGVPFELRATFGGGAVAIATAPPCLFDMFGSSGFLCLFVLSMLGGCDSNCPAWFVLFFFFFRAFNLSGGAIFERASQPTSRILCLNLRCSTSFSIGGRVAVPARRCFYRRGCIEIGWRANERTPRRVFLASGV
jgi:hypothetical protein